MVVVWLNLVRLSPIRTSADFLKKIPSAAHTEAEAFLTHERAAAVFDFISVARTVPVQGVGELLRVRLFLLLIFSVGLEVVNRAGRHGEMRGASAGLAFVGHVRKRITQRPASY